MLIKRLSLIAYIRDNGSDLSAKEQVQMLDQYCGTRNWHIVAYFDSDTAVPSFGLSNALNTLDQADGIIAVDLNRFVTHPEKRLFELKKFIEKMLHRQKVLITVRDGVETITPAGQEAIMDSLNEWKDRSISNLPTTTAFLESDAS